MNNRIKLLIIYVLFSNSIFAVQYKNIKHTDTVNIELSSVDPNIISASNDRISRFTSLKGIVNANIDQNNGELILKPNIQNNNTPFSMIVSTEKGNRYTLLVIPKKIPSQDVILKNTNIDDAKKENSENKYSTEISDLIRAMIQGEKLERYSIKDNKDVSEKSESALIREFKGDRYNGEVLMFKNQTNESIKISEKKFHASNVLAISIGESEIKPGSRTNIYRVVKNG